jgi:hypothetical protein
LCRTSFALTIRFVLHHSSLLRENPVSAEESGGPRRRTFITAGALGVGTGIALATGSTAAASAPDVGTASFDNLGGGVVLSPGGVANWWFDRGGGSDFGFQAAGPNILAPLNGVRHTFFNGGKAVFDSGYVQYYVSIRNDGAAAAVHNLEGGGAT